MNDDSIYCTALNEPEVSISLFVGLRTISAEADEDEWLDVACWFAMVVGAE